MVNYTEWRSLSDGRIISATPDSVVDNFEDADADPAGPYASGETITDYYTITAGDFSRTTSNAIADSYSLERTSASGNVYSDAIVSLDGDGLPIYPTEGETVSLIVKNADVFPSVLSAAPERSAKGYAVQYVDSSDFRLRRLGGGGSQTELAAGNDSAGLPAEIVVKPPASDESTVEASVWSLNADLTRDTRQDQISATDSNFAGEIGVGVVAISASGTGVFADNLRIGRGI
jgi:hypothetical protein